MKKLDKKTKKADKKKQKQQKELKRNAQSSIKYDMMLHDGTAIFNNGIYSQTIEFQDINYVTENDEERRSIFNHFMGLINSSSNPQDFMMTIINKPVSEEEFTNKVFIQEKENDDGHNAKRREWNDTLVKKLGADSSKIETKRYFTFSVKEDSLERARNSLNILSRELRNKLARDLDSQSKILDGWERLNVIYGIFKPYEKFIFDYEQINPSFTTKDAIAPDVIDFRYATDMFKIDNRFCKVFYLKNWSTEIFDELIYRLTKLEFNQVITLHMKAIERGEDISLIKTQIAQMEMEKIAFQQKAIDKGYDPEMLPHEFKYSYDEAQLLLEDVQQRNQRLYDCQFLIMLNADSKEQLEIQEGDLQAVFKELSCVLAPLNYEQEDGFNASLPIGNMYSGKTRLLTTAAAAGFIPFVSKELFDDNGMYYGVNTTTGNLLYVDRRKMDNPGGWEFGKPGSGKSFAAKREIYFASIMSDDDIIVIDPENEYGSFIRWLGGEAIDISVNGSERVNPWDGDMNQNDFMTDKMQFAQSYSATIMGNRDGLSAKEKSIVDRVARKMYGDYATRLAQMGDKAIPPTGLEYYEILKQQPEIEAQNMAVSHELYSTGTYDVFAHESNINANNRIMCYNILNLDEVLKPLGMMVILESLWNKIMDNRKKGRRTWIWADEIYLLFKYDYSAKFFYELYKRARKYGAIVTGITQNVEDLLASPEARSMLSNSQFVLMFNQSQTDAEELAELLHLSDAQLNHILTSKPGSGLISVNNNVITFEDEADKKSELYKMANTKFDELHG